MNKRYIYLFLALLLPGLVFLFLKFFGENKFDIPVYYQHGVSDSINNCRVKTSVQYSLPDSVLEILKWKNDAPLLGVELEEDEIKSVHQILTDIGARRIQLVSLNSMKYDHAKLLKNCILFLQNPSNAVLVDPQKRIRGYYKLGNRDEYDRLEVELKILLKRY